MDSISIIIYPTENAALSGVGGFDISPYVSARGLNSTRNDIDEADTWRMDDNILRRVRGAIFEKMTLNCTGKGALTTQEITAISKAILPQTFFVNYYNIEVGDRVTDEMYTNNVTRIHDRKGMWIGLQFPLIATGRRL